MDTKEKIDLLMTREQYSICATEKSDELFEIMKFQLKNHLKNENLKNFYEKIKPLDEINNLSEIPPLHVSLFKKYDLKLVSDSKIVRTLTSSGTTSQAKSKIYLDKETAFRQSKALNSILKSHIGKERMPMIVIDSESVVSPKSGMSARGAAIRGLSLFGRDIVYVLDGEKDLELNVKRLEQFIEKHRGEEFLIFGFTYIIWEFFYKILNSLGRKFNIKGKLIHSGGWKKLENQKVSRDVFNEGISGVLGIQRNDVLDMYGLVEQVGVVFIDCEKGFKHTPNFAEVIIRNPEDMKEVEVGQEGLIEILSVLPESYPGQAIITEDIGVLVGVDDCECGRKGKYFKFVSRIKQSEARGCGDTFSR